jgi:hypothetical protein
VASSRSSPPFARLVAPGGRLLVIARARDEHENRPHAPAADRTEIESFRRHGLSEVSIVDFIDHEGRSAAG